MQTHQINVSRARDMVQEIRDELFEFPEVLEVFVTGRPDWVVVVSQGRPRPGDWLRALRAAGFHVPVRRHVRQTAEADRQGEPTPGSTPAPGYGDTPAPGLTAQADRRVSDRTPTLAVLAATVPAGQS